MNTVLWWWWFSLCFKVVIIMMVILCFQQCKGKYQRAILYVSGDALRVVDEISKVSCHISVYICMCIYLSVFNCVCLYVRLCVCVCMYVYMFQSVCSSSGPNDISDPHTSPCSQCSGLINWAKTSVYILYKVWPWSWWCWNC